MVYVLSTLLLSATPAELPADLVIVRGKVVTMDVRQPLAEAVASRGDQATWQGFTPDGARLVVVCSHANAIHVWDLRAIRTRLKNMNLDWDWPEFAPAQGPTAEVDKVDIVSSLDNALYSQMKLDAVIAPYRKAIELDPKHAGAHYNLGLALGEQGKLDEAIAAYQEALRLKPTLAKEIIKHLAWDFIGCSDPMPCDPKRAVELVEQLMAQNPSIAQNPNPELLASLLASSAPMLLLANDTDAYRQLCAGVIAKLGDTKEPRTAYLVARICALAPDAASDPTRLVQLAERVVRAQPGSHHLHMLGLAHYRAGQFDEAIKQLNKSIDRNWSANAANWLVLAMAHQRLGHAEEARKWLDKAVRWMDNTGLEAPRDSVDALKSLHRHDSMACMVLRREAETLLGLRPRPALEGKQAPGEKKKERACAAYGNKIANPSWVK